jgi:hypothetical protein
MFWHVTIEETNVTLHDTVFWACADSMMKSGHSSFLANCIGQYSRMARRLSVLFGGKLWKDMSPCWCMVAIQHLPYLNEENRVGNQPGLVKKEA